MIRAPDQPSKSVDIFFSINQTLNTATAHTVFRLVFNSCLFLVSFVFLFFFLFFTGDS